jgi:hypothetical protein
MRSKALLKKYSCEMAALVDSRIEPRVALSLFAIREVSGLAHGSLVYESVSNEPDLI